MSLNDNQKVYQSKWNENLGLSEYFLVNKKCPKMKILIINKPT